MLVVFIKCIAATQATITESCIDLYVYVMRSYVVYSKLLTSHSTYTYKPSVSCGTHTHMCVADI